MLLIYCFLPAAYTGTSAAPAPTQEEQDAAAAAPNRVSELQANGFSKEDAIAALVVSKNDIAAAIDYHIQHMDKGGAAKVGWEGVQQRTSNLPFLLTYMGFLQEQGGRLSRE